MQHNKCSSYSYNLFHIFTYHGPWVMEHIRFNVVGGGYPLHRIYLYVVIEIKLFEFWNSTDMHLFMDLLWVIRWSRWEGGDSLLIFSWCLEFSKDFCSSAFYQLWQYCLLYATSPLLTYLLLSWLSCPLGGLYF